MSFHPRRMWAVYWKDMVDLRHNKGLIASMAVLPLVMVVVPVGVIFAYIHHPDDASLRAVATYYDPHFVGQAADAAAFLVRRTLTDWFGLFLVMPVFVPILISSQSVAGEKERRTLEPLLASPVSASELIAGKSLAAVVPAVAITWLAVVIFTVAVDAISAHWASGWLMPDGLWLFGMLFLAPTFAFFGNGVAVLVSARVSEARTAQQISALVILPLVGLVAGQVAGWLTAGPSYYALQGAVVLLLDVLLVAIGVRLFDRERLVGRVN